MAAALGKLFSWATQHRLITVNPALGMFRPKSPTARARVLSDAEVRALWKACNEIGFPFGSVVKLLLLTGQRRREVAGMRWSELSDDLKATRDEKPEHLANGYSPILIACRRKFAAGPRTCKSCRA